MLAAHRVIPIFTCTARMRIALSTKVHISPLARDHVCMLAQARLSACGAHARIGMPMRIVRAWMLTKVRNFPSRYLPFFAGGASALERWLRRMQNRAWGDNVAVQALADALRRPMIIWRAAEPARQPTCCPPQDFSLEARAQPIYLLLDERRRGSEHYDARMLMAPPAATRPMEKSEGKTAPAARPKPTPDLKKRPASAKPSGVVWKIAGGCAQEHSLQMLCDGTMESRAAGRERTAVAGAMDVQVNAIRALDEAMQGGSLTHAGTRQDDRPHENTGDHISQMACAWAEEQRKQFRVSGGVLPPKHSSLQRHADRTELKEQSWIATGSWSFCPHCGRRRPDGKLTLNWEGRGRRVVEVPCRGHCDPCPRALLKNLLDEGGSHEVGDATLPEPRVSNIASAHKKRRSLKAYVTPQIGDWPEELRCLGEADAKALSIIDLHVDFKRVKGGSAPITSKKKTSLTKATWRKADLEPQLPSDAAKKAFTWLMQHNATYHHYIQMHRQILAQPSKAEGWHIIPTAQLLLRMPGVEVAARPWLYPVAAFGDTDIKDRLVHLGWLGENQKPSTKTSWLRKVLSRCAHYQEDFCLQALLHDISLARQISAVVAVADARSIAPDEAASNMQCYAEFWKREAEKLEDMCRQHAEKPNLFFTVAPAEWKFPIHEGMLAGPKGNASLEDVQTMLALHMYHVLVEVIENLLLKKELCAGDAGIENVFDYSIRFEFQDRGTLHVHVVAWVKFATSLDPRDVLSGRSGVKNSKLVAFLENAFRASVDVQCGSGEHCLLAYVTGYTAKASDALVFKAQESTSSGSAASQSRWRQIYRMLCKRAPLEQEMALEFATLPLMRASYRGDHIYPPIPGSSASNQSRQVYEAFLQWQTRVDSVLAEPVTFIEWARAHAVETSPLPSGGFSYKVRARGNRGPASSKERTALAVSFPFELLDIFIGAWCAMFVPHRTEKDFLLRKEELAFVPEGTRFLKAALQHPRFHGDVDLLLRETCADLRLRGLGRSRIRTFSARVRACALLLAATQRGDVSAESWSAKRCAAMPERTWSPEQSEVLQAVEAGMGICDANVAPNSRILQVTGGPGTGKTEVIIQCALDAARHGARVLVACPIGPLVTTYRQRLPADGGIVVETIHSSFRITRKADQLYIPPGRLRHYDLIIFDEVSQIDAKVWTEVRAALSELSPGPFVVFVGDFQQLQPVAGAPLLETALHQQVSAGALKCITLQQHPAARCADPELLDFLNHVRVHQPSRQHINDFFHNRRLEGNLDTAVRQARAIEGATGKAFTFLTVTNAAAAAINASRVSAEFPEAMARIDEDGMPADLKAGGGKLVFEVGMRIRLTRNLDKDRGFVNGAVGAIEHVLRSDVFVLRTTAGVRLLVHPVHIDGDVFMPASYAYAMTIRRAQGSTLDLVGLHFDRRMADRGYAYVASSRVRSRGDLWLVGRTRRTDWLPVGGDPRGQEQLRPGDDSASSDSEYDSDAFDCSSSEAETMLGAQSLPEDDDAAIELNCMPQASGGIVGDCAVDDDVGGLFA